MAKKRKNTKPKKVIYGIVTNKVNNYDNDPFIIKKAEDAKAFLRRVGLPKGFPPVKF